MSTPEHTQRLEDEGEGSDSLPSTGRPSSDFPWASIDGQRMLPDEMSLYASGGASLPTELQYEDEFAWTPAGEADRSASMFSGASPSLDGYLDRQGSPRRLSARLDRMHPDMSRDGNSYTLSELPPDVSAVLLTTPRSAQDTPKDPNYHRDHYLSDSQLPTEEFSHRRNVSASSVRLRTLPSLRRGESGKRRPAVLQRKRNNVMKQALSRGTVAPGQPSKVWRVRDGKFLQMDWTGPAILEQSACDTGIAHHGPHTPKSLPWNERLKQAMPLYTAPGMGINLPELHKVLVERFGEDKVTVFPRPPEHVHPARVSREFSGELLEMSTSRENAEREARREAVDQANILHLYYSDPNGHLRGEAVYVEYGSVVTWGIPIDLHSEVVFNLAGEFLEDPKDYGAIQADSMRVQVVDGAVKPSIRNDTIHLHHELFDQLEVRVGMSLALAQSTRLSMQEELTMRIIARTKNYPALLVQHGHVHFNEEDLSKTIGSVFLEKTELNLQVLSGPYNYPKFFSSCPDHVQKLYSLVSDNFNLDDRAEILNRRFGTLTDMLDLLRDQQSSAHEEHLSRIVIFLIFSTMCLGLLQILSTIFGARFGAAVGLFSGW